MWLKPVTARLISAFHSVHELLDLWQLFCASTLLAIHFNLTVNMDGGLYGEI